MDKHTEPGSSFLNMRTRLSTTFFVSFLLFSAIILVSVRLDAGDAETRPGDAVSPGDSVAADVVFIPGTIISLKKDGGSESFYILAAGADSAYVENARGLADEFNEFLSGLRRESPACPDNADCFASATAKYESLLEKTTRPAPDPEETICVELARFDAGLLKRNWRRAAANSLKTGGGDIRALPGFAAGENSSDSSPERPEYAKLAHALEQLLDSDPPDMLTPLPDLDSYGVDTFSESQVSQFNIVVELYNRELRRRRAFILSEIEADIGYRLLKLETMLGKGLIRHRGTSIETPQQVSDAYFTQHGARPLLFSREQCAGNNCFFEKYYATTTCYINSYPTGAEVTLNGEKMGPTPLAADYLVPRETVFLQLSKKGYIAHEDSLLITPQASGVCNYDAVLSRNPD